MACGTTLKPRVRQHATGRVTMYERPVFIKLIYYQYSFALGDQLLKSLTAHIEETEALEQLEEGLLRKLVRSGAVLANANASKRHGDTAVIHLRGVANIIRKPLPQETKDQVEE